METKRFSKNDEGFICEHCGAKVSKLEYTSRDHCNKCLYSLHIDINPGDRQNLCGGLLVPIDVEIDRKKGYVIVYKCKKCGQVHRNRAAQDDNFEAILSLMNKTYDERREK